MSITSILEMQPIQNIEKYLLATQLIAILTKDKPTFSVCCQKLESLTNMINNHILDLFYDACDSSELTICNFEQLAELFDGQFYEDDFDKLDSLQNPAFEDLYVTLEAIDEEIREYTDYVSENVFFILDSNKGTFHNDTNFLTLLKSAASKIGFCMFFTKGRYKDNNGCMLIAGVDIGMELEELISVDSLKLFEKLITYLKGSDCNAL